MRTRAVLPDDDGVAAVAPVGAHNAGMWQTTATASFSSAGGFMSSDARLARRIASLAASCALTPLLGVAAGCPSPTPRLAAITEDREAGGEIAWAFGYDDKGFLRDLVKRDDDTTVVTEETWDFEHEDQGFNGNPLVRVNYTTDVEGDADSDVTFRRGDGNRIEGCSDSARDAETTFTIEGGVPTKSVFKTDDTTSTTTFRTSELGDLIALDGETETADGTTKQTIAVDYDDDENIGAFDFDVDGEDVADIAFAYDDERRVTQITFAVQQAGQTTTLRSELSYDEDGRLASIERTGNIDDGDTFDISSVDLEYEEGEASGVSAVPTSIFVVSQLFDLGGRSHETIDISDLETFCIPAW